MTTATELYASRSQTLAYTSVYRLSVTRPIAYCEVAVAPLLLRRLVDNHGRPGVLQSTLSNLI